jgi:methionine synthase I (cobalamin-dependent)
MDILEDAYDVRLWLCEKYAARHLKLWVSHHYSCMEDEIAQIELRAIRASPREATSSAYEAFRALGYMFKETGADLISIEAIRDPLSNHDVLRAYARVEVALEKMKKFSN